MKVDRFQNLDIDNLCTPIKIDQLEDLLRRTHYIESEIKYLTKGFRQGFSIGYKGPKDRRDSSRNIPIIPGVGSKVEMWNKVMKEVKLKRFAGPFKNIPFPNFIQSPIGLVPKAGGQTRLIFHLSYNFKNGNKSVNHWTPKERCSVKYNDIDHAVANCLHFMKSHNGSIKGPLSQSVDDTTVVFRSLFFGKTDLKSAFRVVPIKRKHWWILILKCEDPESGETYYFVDKCMPFGASISCAHFQRLSNALRHIVETMEKAFNSITNYLDDFLFIHFLRSVCENLMIRFMQICNQINFPVAEEKTDWPDTLVTFLGLLLNGKNFTLMITEEKKSKTLSLLHTAMDK